MTDPGYRRRDSALIPLTEGDIPMHELVNIIRRLEEIRGGPLVVELAPPVLEHTQRLMGTLGVLVRFTPEPKGTK